MCADMIYEIDSIPLGNVRIDGKTQSRVALNDAAIAEYAEAIRIGIDLPPIVTFFDGVNFWLADGFHRYHAHRTAGAMEINSELREGTCRDAILYSVGANSSHGLRRTNEDKRKAVLTLLNDAEWATWSGRDIAKSCGVSHTFVDSVKSSLATLPVTSSEITYTTKHGTTATMNTANIGKVKQPSETARVPQAHDVPHANHLDDAVVSPVTTPTVDSDEVQALREQLAEVSDALKSTLADNEMMGRVFDADDRVKASMNEAIRQKAIADNAERTLAAKNGEYIERARAVTHWMNRAQKAEKKLEALGGGK